MLLYMASPWVWKSKNCMNDMDGRKASFKKLKLMLKIEKTKDNFRMTREGRKGCHSVKIKNEVSFSMRQGRCVNTTSPWVLKNNINEKSMIDKGRTEGCQSKRKSTIITVARPSCAYLYMVSPGSQKE